MNYGTLKTLIIDIEQTYFHSHALSIASNFSETLLEFWGDLKVILNKHPKLLLLFDNEVSGVEWSIVRNEAIVENATNLLVYFLDIHMKNYPTSRNRFNKILNTNTTFTVLQKQWNELSKMYLNSCL